MKIVDKIACYEWDMLLGVNSKQAHLECKNNKFMFFLMRKSQWEVYSPEIQSSYLCDIHKAVSEHRNLMIEKYGYMMAETDPEIFNKIRHELPEITQEKQSLVEKIIACHKVWYDQAKALLPETIGAGRTTSPNNPHLASVQNYLRGELYTYSVNTLQKIAAYNEECNRKGINLVVEIHKHYVNR